MIGKLKGIVDTVMNNHIILMVAGVGYKIFVGNSASACVDSELSLLIEHIQKEDSQELYGFATQTELELFNLLRRVPSLGPKTCIKFFQFHSAASILNSIINENPAALTAVPGVGMKVAERIILEIKNKKDLKNILSNLQEHSLDSRMVDSVSAVTGLGFSRTIVEPIVHECIKTNPDFQLDQIISYTLKKLG